VCDADLAGYFRQHSPRQALACVRMRVWTFGTGIDPTMAERRRWWSRQGRETPDRATNERGTPQGGVLSPLLANVYLHWFDHVFHGWTGRPVAKAKLVRYADDFVCWRGM